LYEVIMSPEANDDLDRIYLGIAMAGFPDNAHAFTDKIAVFCQELRRFPNRGTARPEVAPGLRTIWISSTSHDRLSRVGAAEACHRRSHYP
jgi:toxin ParE1/3/4